MHALDGLSVVPQESWGQALDSLKRNDNNLKTNY